MTSAQAKQPSAAPVLRDQGAAAIKARLAVTEISVLVILVACVALAQAFPFKPIKYGIIALLGVTAVVQATRRPAMGLAMLAFATPAMDVVPPNLLGVRGLNAETLLLGFALFIWSRASHVEGRDGFGVPLGRVVLVYSLLIVVSCVNSWLIWKSSLFDLVAAAKNHLSYMVFLPVAFHTLKSKRDQWLLVGTISLALLLNFAQGIHGSIFAFLSGALDRHRAISILAIQPNAFGAAIAMYLPLLVVLAFNKTANRLTQLWFLAVSGAAGFALLLTLSRGSWLGAALGLFATALFRERKLLIVLILASVFYQAWVPKTAIERVEVTTRTEGQDMADDQIAEDSTQMRIEQYKSLPAMMAPRPILGWGYKSFPQVFEKLGTLKRNKGAHSSYCQLGTEGGAVGLFALLAVMAGMTWAGFEAARVTTDPFHRWIGVAVLGGSIAMGFCMASGARFEPQKIFAFFWILVGIAQREAVLVKREAPRAAPLVAGVGRLTSTALEDSGP